MTSIMRLYRGITKAYQPGLVPTGRLSGTDFTDCPATALLYARGARGMLLVLDVPDERGLGLPRVREDLWLARGPKRFMVWGKFDPWLSAVLPAKDLRTRLRREGLPSAPDAIKAGLLRRVIDHEIASRIVSVASA